MKANFLAYLAAIPAYVQESLIPDQHHKLYVQTEQNVVAAKEGQLGKLGRVFNDYPHHIETEEKSSECGYITLEAVDLDTLQQLQKAAEAILVPDAFILGDNGYIPDTKILDKISQYINLLITIACEHLLTPKGDLEPAVIQFLKIESLLAQFENDIGGNQVKFQIIFSFISQLLIAHSLPELGNKLEKEGKDTTMIGPLTYYISHYFSNNDGKISSYFEQAINSYLCENHHYIERRVANILSTLHPGAIKKIVINDISFLPEGLKDFNKLCSHIFKRRFVFWNTVCEELHEIDSERARVITHAIPASECSQSQNTPPASPASATGKPLFSRPLSVEEQEEVSIDLGVATELYQVLYRQCTMRDNLVILDHLIYSLTDKNSKFNLLPMLDMNHIFNTLNKFEKFKTFSQIIATRFFRQLANNSELSKAELLAHELTQMKYQPDLIALNFKELFQKMYELVTPKAKFLLIAQQVFANLIDSVKINLTDILSTAIENEQWHIIFEKMMNAPSTTALPVELKNQLVQCAGKFEILLIELLKNSNPFEKRPIINKVLTPDNLLGVILKSANDKLLYSLLPHAAIALQEYCWLHLDDEQTTPLKIALENNQWENAIEIMEGVDQGKKVTEDESYLAIINRSHLCTALLKYLDKQYGDNVELKKNYVAKVLTQQNQLGIALLKSNPQTILLFKAPLVQPIRECLETYCKHLKQAEPLEESKTFGKN